MSKPLRIGLVCPYSLSRPGGVQGQVTGLARALQKRGHDVTVLAPADGTGVDDGEVPVKIVGRTVGLRSNGSVAPVSLAPNAARRVARWSRGADVMHLHEPLAPVVGYGCLLTRPTALIGTYHRAGSSAWYRALVPAVKWANRRLDVSCAVSEAAAATATGATGIQPDVLFNGVEVDRISGAEPWEAEHPTVLFLGRHEHRKGLGVLLQAFEKVPDPAVLWIAGDGPTTSELQRCYPESPRVHWLGVLAEDDVARRLGGATVLCAPSLFGESFGMVLLEGLAAGCAVVASDIPGYRDASGGFATLSPPGDVAALASVLENRLASGRPERGAAFAHAEHWSMTHLAEEYEGVYERAIAHRLAK